GRSRVTLDVQGVKAAGRDVKSLAVNLVGTPAAHTLKVDLDSSTARLAAALQGAYGKRDRTWDFTLNALQVAYGELVPWTLAAPATGQLAAGSQHIANACLNSGEARLCIDGRHDGDGTTASLQLTGLAFAYA